MNEPADLQAQVAALTERVEHLRIECAGLRAARDAAQAALAARDALDTAEREQALRLVDELRAEGRPGIAAMVWLQARGVPVDRLTTTALDEEDAACPRDADRP